MSSNFFHSFKNFCSQLDKDIKSAKTAFSQPSRQKPSVYYEGLGILQKEVLELKELHSSACTQVAELKEASSAIEKFKIKFLQQEKRILDIEAHLIKFGYTPLEIKPLEDKDDVSSCNDVLMEPEEERRLPDCLVSPELSKFSNCPETALTINKPVEIPVETPRRNDEIPPLCPFTPMSTTHKERVKSWLSTIDSNQIVYDDEYMETLDEHESPQSIQYSRADKVSKTIHLRSTECAPKGGEEKSNFSLRKVHALTPDEPTLLSSLNLKAKGLSDTPEEPVLSKFAANEIPNEKNATPEEPPLSKFAANQFTHERHATPEEPVLSSCSGSIHHIYNNLSDKQHPPDSFLTPNLAVENHEKILQNCETKKRNTDLSHFSSSISMRDQVTFKEPSVNGLDLKKKPLHLPSKLIAKDDFCPASPQLSDVTQHIMNLKSLNCAASSLTKTQVPSISIEEPISQTPPKENFDKINKENLSDNIFESPVLHDTTMRFLSFK